jgi:hypothetical protein
MLVENYVEVYTNQIEFTPLKNLGNRNKTMILGSIIKINKV